MKKKYIKPFAEAVNIRMNSSTLDDTVEVIGGSDEEATTWDANEQHFELEDEAGLPGHKTNLWDD